VVLLVKQTGREGEFSRVDLLDQSGPPFWVLAGVSNFRIFLAADERVCFAAGHNLSVSQFHVFKGGREPYERLNFIRIPFHPGAERCRRIRVGKRNEHGSFMD
jgi:hypothetical protein